MNDIVITDQVEEVNSRITPELIESCCKIEKSKDLLAGMYFSLDKFLSAFDESEHNDIVQELQQVPIETLISILEKNGVSYGINQNALLTMFQKAQFASSQLVARGKPQRDGVDGYVKEHFSREREIKPQLLENGDSDHKELGLILDIEKGTIIADIVLPEPPVNGIGVSGKEIQGRPGKEPVVPQGTNTAISADGKHLIANVGGNLVFKQGKFCIEQLVTIKGNVDSSIGNINFSGDIVINGDVFLGYTITSKKNIKITGSVEGANLIADGDITVGLGINGQQKGVVMSKGNVKAMFIENCEMYAEGAITAQVIINSHVSSEESIAVTTGKGVISGGEIIAVKKIEAVTVGSEVNIPTIIRLGLTPRLTQNIKELEQSIEEMMTEIDLIAKNITYLEYLEQQGQITSDRKELLVKLKAKKPTMSMMLKRLNTDLELKIESSNSLEFCEVSVAKELNPPVKVFFGSTINKTIDKTYGRCIIRLLDGDVRISV